MLSEIVTLWSNLTFQIHLIKNSHRSVEFFLVTTDVQA